jgi:hypothetical protein
MREILPFRAPGNNPLCPEGAKPSWFLLGGNDNGVHNLLGEGVLDHAEEDEVADYIETARLASSSESWDELKGILAEDYEDELRLWKKRYGKTRRQPQ